MNRKSFCTLHPCEDDAVRPSREVERLTNHGPTASFDGFCAHAPGFVEHHEGGHYRWGTLALITSVALQLAFLSEFGKAFGSRYSAFLIRKLCRR
jgi:hypothetical protein